MEILLYKYIITGLKLLKSCCNFKLKVKLRRAIIRIVPFILRILFRYILNYCKISYKFISYTIFLLVVFDYEFLI